MNMIRELLVATALAMIILLDGCSTPVGVRPADGRTVYRHLTENAISGDQPSAYTNQFLARLGLLARFKQDPRPVLAGLHAGLGGADDQSRRFVLAELCYLHARQSGEPQYFLAATLYAYQFLFPRDHALDPIPYDPRLRMAMDLYNRALTNALRVPGKHEVDLSPRRLELPFGHVQLMADAAHLNYGGFKLTQFIPVEDFEIHGLRNHYRKPGIGAALSARALASPGNTTMAWFPSQGKFPVTAFLRFEEPGAGASAGNFAGKIEIHDVDITPNVEIDRRIVPLESDPSATLAYRLNDSPIWDFEIAGFRRGDFNPFGRKEEGSLFFLAPYRPGRIPVVFVHGTASSPARWAEISNELLSDPNIASRYQLWFFIYNSGNPIALSAMHLREELTAARQALDPQGKDPALDDLVVIGHSQGGLLTKMTAVSSGTKFWENISKESFADARLTSTTRDLLSRGLFIEPLPFVKRLIFIATPHHGSYMAEDFLGKTARRFINLPAVLSKTSLELVKLNPTGAARMALQMPTAIDNMDSSNPFLKTLSTLPIAPGVHAHSIIPFKKEPYEQGLDGVVRYSSAHIEGVDSELVVRSGHSCQSNPQTIEEVRRILYLHAHVPGAAD